MEVTGLLRQWDSNTPAPYVLDVRRAAAKLLWFLVVVMAWRAMEVQKHYKKNEKMTKFWWSYGHLRAIFGMLITLTSLAPMHSAANLGSCAGLFIKKAHRFQLPCFVVKWDHLCTPITSALRHFFV